MEIAVLLLMLFLWGLVVGALARFALPGPDPMSMWRTAALGILGALLGGIAGRLLFAGTGGLVLGLLGAIVLLALHRRFVQRRALTGRPL